VRRYLIINSGGISNKVYNRVMANWQIDKSGKDHERLETGWLTDV